jgi:diguanylate cyclase (GGDEF)-like protein/PAS domain S-box-containing protein
VDSIAKPAPTILIIDDQPQNRRLLDALLVAEGYLTLSAASGEEALAAIAIRAPDLLLLDVMMPGMDGYEVARRLKANPATSNIPIIMVTAKLDRATRLEGLKAGAEEFLTIPVDRAELSLRVRNLLRLKDLGDFHRDQSEILEQQVQARTADLQRFRTAMDATADGIFLVSRSAMRFVEVNKGACSMLGYTRQEFLQMGPSQLIPVPAEQLASDYDELIAGGAGSGLVETQLLRKDGSRIEVESRRHVQNFGDDWIIVGVVRDITNRKRLELEAHETRSFIASILDNIPNSIFVKDARNLKFVRVNAACENLTGYSERELLGKSDHDLFPKEQADYFVAKDRETLAGKQHVFIVEETITSKDGTERHLQTKKFPILDDDGNPQYLLGMSEDVTQRHRAQELLRKSEARFRGFVEQSPDAMLIHQAGRIIFANDTLVRLLRAGDTDTLLGKTGLSLVHPEHKEISAQRKERLYAGQTVPLVEQVYLRFDGTSVDVEVASSPIVLEDQPAALVTIREITARKEQERRIARLSRIRDVLSGINSAIVRIRDDAELFKEACRIAVEQGGFSMAWIGLVDREALKVKPVAWAGAEQGMLAVIEPRLILSGPASSRGIVATAVAEKAPVVVNDVAKDARVATLVKEHRQRSMGSLAILPLVVSGEAVGVLSLHAESPGFFDDEEMKLLVELAADIAFSMDHIEKGKQLSYLAYYDALTGLANRSLFLERVAQYMRSAATGGHGLAVFFLDLERFKNINDSLGRPAGDALLKQVAEFLARDSKDPNLLARLGADHFAIVVPALVPGGNIASLLDRKMRAFIDHTFHLGDTQLRIALKVGGAIFPDDGTDADTLFKHAEAALKAAKASGERYLFYTRKMTEKVAGKLTLEYQLREALDRGEFVLHYQPKVHLVSGKLTGAEALIRWLDPRTGLVPPARFIPILEETGLIYEVGRWALGQAVEDYLHWRRAGLPAIRIAVNVSPLQLRNRAFTSEIAQAIGIDAGAAAGLELEITESLVMEDVLHNIASLQAIRAMGVSIAIDDFGTGFSSLSYLSKLPVDTLKIDRSFVLDMTTGAQGLALVSTIVNLAHSLKLKVVAEGVETQEQSRLLRSLDCDEMQGFLVSKPVPREIFETRFLTPRRDLPVPSI